MRRFTVFLLIAMLVMSALPAAAAEPEEILVELEFRNYAAEQGTSIDINALEDLVVDSNAAERGIYFVILRRDPSGGNDLFAASLIGLDLPGSVVVISPSEIGAASSVFDDTVMGEVVDKAFDDFEDGNDFGALKTFAEQLPGSSTATTEQTATTSAQVAAQPAAAESGGGGGFIFLLFVVVIVGGIGFMIWRSSKRSKEAAAGRLDEAKGELKGQLAVIANEILDLSDRVIVAENEKALALYRSANDTYSEVTEAADTVATLVGLEDLSDRLDRARWQLEASEALIEGREAPPEPEDRPAHCFFDPAHRAGVEEAEIRTPAGSKMVGVCRECAAKLRNGETPKPRSINVGGRPVPAPQAPRSYGGGGLDWLDAFSVLLGGRGSGVDYNFGPAPRAARPARGSGGSVLGRLGSRSTAPINRTSSTTTRSTPRSSSRSTSTRSSKPSRPSSPPKVKGRARRRRK